MNEEELLSLRKFYLKDFGIPTRVVESPWFDKYLELFEERYKAKTNYDLLLNEVNEVFGGSVSDFLEDQHRNRHIIIDYLKDHKLLFNRTAGFKSFMNNTGFGNAGRIENRPMSYLKQHSFNSRPTAPLSSSILSSTEWWGQNWLAFVSFDLKQANYQSIRLIDPNIVRNCDTWEEFVESFGIKSEYFKRNKAYRQRILGTVDQDLISYVIHSVMLNCINNLIPGYLFGINNDEVYCHLYDKDLAVIEFNRDCPISSVKSSFDLDFAFLVERNHGIYLTPRTFIPYIHTMSFHENTKQIKTLVLETLRDENGNKTGTDKYLECPHMYFPQVYKSILGMEITEDDLYYSDSDEGGKLKKFETPLQIVE